MFIIFNIQTNIFINRVMNIFIHNPVFIHKYAFSGKCYILYEKKSMRVIFRGIFAIYVLCIACDFHRQALIGQHDAGEMLDGAL